MNDFEYDVKQKKRLAQGARHRVKPHKGCRLPHEDMSREELDAMNGPVTTYNVNMPMPWAAFQTLKHHQQVLYLDTLRMRYAPTADMLAEAFGTTRTAVAQYLRAHDLPRQGERKKRCLSPEEREAWAAFCGGGAEKKAEAERKKRGAPCETMAAAGSGESASPASAAEVERRRAANPSRLQNLSICLADIRSWEELYEQLRRFPIPETGMSVVTVEVFV